MDNGIMKLIFLDVDGVLNHSKIRQPIGKGLHVLDEECAQRLIRIVYTTNAYIVLSSTWRLSRRAVEVLKDALRTDRIIGATPVNSHGPRKHEILDWLQTVWPLCHGWDYKEITHVAVIDDDTDADLGDGSFFLTNAYTGGLTEEITKEVIKYLNGA